MQCVSYFCSPPPQNILIVILRSEERTTLGTPVEPLELLLAMSQVSLLFICQSCLSSFVSKIKLGIKGS